MKKFNVLFLLAILMSSLFVACGTDQKEETAEIKIKTTENSKLLKFTTDEKIGEIQDNVLKFTVNEDQVKQVMESNYKDNTKIQEVYLAKEEGKYYMYGKGFNDKKESRIIRYPLRPDGNGGLRAQAGGTDSCAGVNCSYCVFTAGSGCSCERSGDPWDGGSSYCNHSTSTGMASLQVLNSAVENAEVNDEGQIQGHVSADQVDPELMDKLYSGQPFTTDTDFVISAETLQGIYANSDQVPPTEGSLTVAAGEYEVDVQASVIVIIIVTDEAIIIIVIS